MMSSDGIDGIYKLALLLLGVPTLVIAKATTQLLLSLLGQPMIFALTQKLDLVMSTATALGETVKTLANDLGAQQQKAAEEIIECNKVFVAG
eukprot:10851176-Karenia_brevis.AAC.1